jgi:solute:Na+ symporter, SSS family
MILLPFIIVLAVSIGASLFASKKEGDFFLASRSIRWPLLVGTFVGTQVGGGFILGNTDASCKLGLCGSLYGIGLALGMLGLGLGIGSRLRKLGVATLPKLLEAKYQSQPLQKAAALLSILSLGGILMCQAIGLRKFLCSMEFSNEWIYILSWAVVVFYTTWGGLLAVVWTDMIQAAVMVSMLAVTFFSALLPKWPVISAQIASMGCPLDGSIIASLLMPFCFIFVEQDMAQRCFAAKSPKDVTKGSLITAAILIILSAIPTMCGILGRALNLTPDNGAVFIQVIKLVSNPFVFIMSASAVLLAIISTASAILLALSSNVAQDMTVSPKNGRLITFILGGSALLGPYLGNDIITWMVGSYEISVGALLVPIMAAVFTKKQTLPSSAAWCAAAFGSFGTLLAQYLSENAIGVALPFILSPLGFAIGWKLWTRKEASACTEAEA